MEILKKIDYNKKIKLKKISKIMKSRKDQYTVLFDEKKLNLLLNKEKIFSSDYKVSWNNATKQFMDLGFINTRYKLSKYYTY